LIKLRAHHLLCIQGFQGYGYSPEFAEEFGKIRDSLYKEDPIVQVVEGMDNICKHCPNRSEEVCKEHLNKVTEMDRTVFEMMGIPKDMKVRFLNAISAANKVFNSKEKLDMVCGKCRWRDVCLFYLSRS